MNILRLWRTNDRFKLAVMLLALAAYLLGYAAVSAGRYMRMLNAPAEYVCALPDSAASIPAQLAQSDAVTAYSPQLTKQAESGGQMLTLTLLSGRYLGDVYGLGAASHTLWMNRAAFEAVCGADAESPAAVPLTVNGQRTDVAAVCCDDFTVDTPFSVMLGTEAELRDALLVRVCMRERAPSPLTGMGLRLAEPEQQVAAAYAQELMLTRVRFAVLAAALAILAAANLRQKARA